MHVHVATDGCTCNCIPAVSDNLINLSQYLDTVGSIGVCVDGVDQAVRHPLVDGTQEPGRTGANPLYMYMYM